jgi:hypothetical protein
MLKFIRRIALVLATSGGIIAASMLTAQALAGHNHCEPRLLR